MILHLAKWISNRHSLFYRSLDLAFSKISGYSGNPLLIFIISLNHLTHI